MVPAETVRECRRMTEALASRVAGLKLGGIVGVLLLPMLVLSFFMVASLRQDMSFAQRELMGVELNRLVMPVAIGAANGKLDDVAIQELRKKGGPLADSLGLRKPFNGALAVLTTYGTDTRYVVETLSKLQLESSTAANIILDPYAESNQLGSVFSQSGPQLLSDFVKVWWVSSMALRDGVMEREEETAILLAAGAWEKSQHSVAGSFRIAQRNSGDLGAYAKPFEIISEMSKHPRNVARLIATSAGSDMVDRLSGAKEFGANASHIINDIQQIWTFATNGFEFLLHSRISSMQVRLYTLLAIAVAACLIGVGGAAMMFRSTLKQLDVVKLAGEKAEAAREDAEQAAGEVKRINEEMVQLNADLASNLKMLREAQDESLKKGKMAQLGQLTATVAHELRNPLGAVRTSAFLLERKVKDKGLGVESQIERINNGVTRCDNIISQLLDFARSKAIQPETIALDDWLSRLIEEEAQKLPAAVAVECHLGLGDLAIAFDPARMSRVIINLLNNASEAVVGKGDDPSKFAAKFPLITIATRITARGPEISIRDNGPGIAPEHAEKILEPLFTTKNFGTGLGLPAVQKILEQHGGGLDFTTQLGQGAVFTAWWPQAAPLKEAV
jgi:signal transduction histidine kinase